MILHDHKNGQFGSYLMSWPSSDCLSTLFFLGFVFHRKSSEQKFLAFYTVIYTRCHELHSVAIVSTSCAIRRGLHSSLSFFYHVLSPFFYSCEAERSYIAVLLVFFYISKNLKCIGALSFFKICSHIFMIFEVKLE